ncbi:death-inducer obliterator 1-like protein [Dinothrombium tinctorium]|uniref:Death-inducer obliterator 1-like protein n=1 Tax=Dinothrombium tinctorium TaxID=1965070 RepID=A0A3S3SH13_9ACAR|nr:death-inducer obliterator 1-like protein [Dinothrombium tinctorium]RWS16671.1 death-inducer obliterator 1-like protein [Dinothrombium tinctorium]
MDQQVSNAVDNNPFLELSSESLNEVLNSDSVKQLLSDSKSFENLAAAILENEAPSSSTLSTSATSTMTTSISAPGHVATVQEGLDLVDALDSLVNQLTNQTQSSSGRAVNSGQLFVRETPPEVDLLGGNLEIGSTIDENWVDSIYLDHNYACVPVKQKDRRKDNQMEIFDLSSGTSSSPTTPQRRSQRQIEKIEKSVLERIKAENQELLKREREEMGGSMKKRDSLEDSLASHDDSENGIEDGLVIDVEGSDKRMVSKRKPARKKKRVSEDEKSFAQSAKKSEDDLENVIAALSGERVEKRDEKRYSGGRSQRQRRKPKRWDDDEVEVDFSGNASELGMEASSVNKKNVGKRESVDECMDTLGDAREKSNATKTKTEESDDDHGSDWGSDDDPDKLWCICRQPHNNRFMICCDGCEDWFHGTCVGVTKKQGRICEQEKRKWFCAKCKEAGKSLEAKNDAMPANVEVKSEKIIKKLTSEEKKDEFAKRLKKFDESKRKEIRMKMGKPKSFKGPIASTEKKEEERLRRLIKNKKLEFKNKVKKEKVEKESEWEPISKVVPIVRKPDDKKKKFKEQSIDMSFQDLFKAEPITMKKAVPGSANSLPSPSSPATPLTPKSAPFQQQPLKRPSLSGEQSSLSFLSSHQQQQQQQRKAILLSGEQLCVTCNKVVNKSGKPSVYCSEACIEKHVKDMTELLKQSRSSTPTVGVTKGEKRVVVVEKSSAKVLTGGNAIPEEKLLEYIRSHPTFEILRPNSNPNLIRKLSTESVEKKKESGPLKSPTKKKEEVNKKDVKKKDEKTKKEESATRPKPKPTQNPFDANATSESKKEIVSDAIRNNICSSLADTLSTRSQEVNELKTMNQDDIKKIASKIEEEMYNYYNKDTYKYKTRYRSLIFNLKDSKNQGLFRKVLTGKIEPSRLVRMSPEELASPELAKWRERENKHMLEMIKRDAEQQAQQVIVKKTHKGEELIETKVKVKAVDVGAVVETGDEKDEKEKSDSRVDDFRPSEDATAKHGQHVFDVRCELCTKQNGKRKSKSEEEPKRVRVELDEPTNKILQEAVKLAKSNTSSSSSRDSFDQDQVPTSTTLNSPPENAPNESSTFTKVNHSSCWKGIICMQDVARFVAAAYRVSGPVESQDIPDVTQVCGRIAPEQVLDYLKKLKYSSRTEISVIRFIPSNHDEKIGYDAFFSYLNQRKRYGVVGNASKSLKDFYILPLPKDVDPPDVLLPFNGPGLEKRYHRHNLLLGILIKSKKVFDKHMVKLKEKADQKVAIPSSTVEGTNQAQERSYTPPPPTVAVKSESVTAPEEEPYDPASSLTPPLQTSYTPPREEEKLKDEEPYDPEDNSSNSNIVDLLEKFTKSTNPNEMTSTILMTIQNSTTLEQQKQLLNELTNKVEESKKQLEEQRRAAEAAFNIATSSAFAANKDTSCIPVFDDPIVKCFGDERLDESDEMKADEPDEEEVVDQKNPEPMELDEEDVKPNTIIEVNNTKQRLDPRLRSKKQQPLNNSSSSSSASIERNVSQLKDEELMYKAQLQLKALKDMEQKQKHLEEAQKQAIDVIAKAASYHPTSSASVSLPSSTSAIASEEIKPKIQMQWKKKISKNVN